MIRRGKHNIKSHMTLEYGFTGIRIQGGLLTPVDWELKVDLIVTAKRGKSTDLIEKDAGIAYQKLYFWLETNLPHSTFVNVGDDDDLYLANLASNIMVYCPGNPSDDLIIQLLHAKLSSLAGQHLIVAEVKLKGSDTSLRYTFDCDDDGYILPTTTEEYYLLGETRDKAPWWSRDDGFCFEFARPPVEDGEDDPGDSIFDDIVDPMSEFFRIIKDADSISVMKEPAKIVQVEKWTPKKVEE